MRPLRRTLLALTTLGICGAASLHAQSTWRVDSLMTTWPVQQRLKEVGSTTGQGVIRAVDTDDLYAKLHRVAPGIPVFADSNVVAYADLYGEPLREHFRVLLGVSQVYFPMIEKELALQGLPKELKYLPMALSGMNTRAGSDDGGSGLWMLSYPVAIRYGLTVTGAVDERRDDVKSTMVAGRYLKDLHARYHDWGMTLMAFACGPANVTRAQQRAGGATDYRALYPHFTNGQREVLPLLMAFIHLTANAEGMGIAPIAITPWELADTLTTERAIHLDALAQVMQLPVGRLQALNPTLSNGTVPAATKFFLPRGMHDRYAQLTDSIQHVEVALTTAAKVSEPIATEPPLTVEVKRTIRYKVRPGDNLGKIAEKHRVTVKQLKAWNNLRSDRINAGRTLVIHVKKREVVKPIGDPAKDLPEDEGSTNEAAPTSLTMNSTPVAVQLVTYTVQSGDSLYRIAKRYPGVTAQHIMEANGIGTAIKPGQKLKIPRP
ncbi:MAG TPA: LysM peptidoglycan-binding domain-containing protein [Flavobacteriales bacterium]|nr:LysM peptidoglycan-binding domain-containing protein [Flavobacteriales bacterium]